MPVLFVIGRVAFVLIFIMSGAQKLMDIGGTADLIAPKIFIPAMAADIARQIETTLGMPMPKIVAILVGSVEVAAGLGLAFNILPRLSSLLLIAFTVATIYYFHDFWNLPDGAEKTDNTIHAMKNVSLIGALIVFFVLGSWRPATVRQMDDDDLR